jgi:hypothetical protein
VRPVFGCTDPPAHLADRELKITGISKACFVDRIQKKPSLLTGRQPFFKSLVGSYLKGILEISGNMLQTNKKRRLSLLPKRVCDVADFGSLARAGLGQNDYAVFLDDVGPAETLANTECLTDIYIIGFGAVF